MTDKEKLLALLSEWGVPYKQEDIPSQPEERGERAVIIGLTGDFPETDKVTGYTGFFTSFEFSLDGEFVRMGAWE